jgi:hypothetical protein
MVQQRSCLLVGKLASFTLPPRTRLTPFVFAGFVLWVCFLVGCVTGSAGSTASYVSPESAFHEQLLLRPLEDGKVLAHFHFQIDSLHSSAATAATHGSGPHSAGHFHLFPKPIGQIIDRFGVEVILVPFYAAL